MSLRWWVYWHQTSVMFCSDKLTLPLQQFNTFIDHWSFWLNKISQSHSGDQSQRWMFSVFIQPLLCQIFCNGFANFARLCLFLFLTKLVDLWFWFNYELWYDMILWLWLIWYDSVRIWDAMICIVCLFVCLLWFMMSIMIHDSDLVRWYDSL